MRRSRIPSRRGRYLSALTPSLMTLTLALAGCSGPVQAPEADDLPSDPSAVIDESAVEDTVSEGPEDADAFPADLPMPEDPAPFIGAYAMTGESPEGPVERALELNGNLEATLTSRWPERSPVPVVETGIWQVSGAIDRPTAIVELDTRDGQPMDGSDVITFELVAPGELLATIYNLDRYGPDTLHFLRSD